MVPRPTRDFSTPGQRVWYRFWTSSVSQWNRANTDRLVGSKGQVNSHCNHWACTFPLHFLIFYIDFAAAPRMSQENRRNMTAYENSFCTSNRKLLTTCSPRNETSFNTIIPTCSVPFNTCYTSCNWWVIGPHGSNVIIIIIIATVIVTVVVLVFIVYSLRTKLFHAVSHMLFMPPKFLFFLETRGKTKITPN